MNFNVFFTFKKDNNYLTIEKEVIENENHINVTINSPICYVKEDEKLYLMVGYVNILKIYKLFDDSLKRLYPGVQESLLDPINEHMSLTWNSHIMNLELIQDDGKLITQQFLVMTSDIKSDDISEEIANEVYFCDTKYQAYHHANSKFDNLN